MKEVDESLIRQFFHDALDQPQRIVQEKLFNWKYFKLQPRRLQYRNDSLTIFAHVKALTLDQFQDRVK